VYAPKGDGKSKLPLSFIAEDPKITNTYLKSPYAYSQGDPHYYGFNKVWFDFNGTVGNYYNIISDVVRFFLFLTRFPRTVRCVLAVFAGPSLWFGPAHFRHPDPSLTRGVFCGFEARRFAARFSRHRTSKSTCSSRAGRLRGRPLSLPSA